MLKFQDSSWNVENKVKRLCTQAEWSTSFLFTLTLFTKFQFKTQNKKQKKNIVIFLLVALILFRTLPATPISLLDESVRPESLTSSLSCVFFLFSPCWPDRNSLKWLTQTLDGTYPPLLLVRHFGPSATLRKFFRWPFGSIIHWTAN